MAASIARTCCAGCACSAYPDLADAEPKTLRYRILHTAARIVRGQRKRKIRIPQDWPWANELHAAFHAALALTAPT